MLKSENERPFQNTAQQSVQHVPDVWDWLRVFPAPKQSLRPPRASQCKRLGYYKTNRNGDEYMQYTWHFQYCPKCKKMYSRHIDKLLGFIKMESGLGPQFIRCVSCGNVFNSGLTEWQQMTTAQKTRYGFLSIFYSGFIGVSLLLPTMVIHSNFSQSGNPQLLPENLFLLIALIVYSLLVLALQVLRTFLSDSRMESTTPEPMDVSFWNWQTNLQFYGLAICLVGDIIFAFIFITMM